MSSRKQQRIDNVHSLITYLDPLSESSEMYQIIRTNLSFSQIDSQKKVIVITSAMKGEGKSITSSNLAIASAMAGDKTVLVDADLRLPTLAHRLGLSNLRGLTTALLKKDNLEDCIQQTVIQNFDVLTSGPLPPNPAETLNSKAMGEIIRQLRQEYDLVILDAPPLLCLSDAQILSRLSDGVILVVGVGIVKRSAARKAKEYLQNAKAHVLGIAINGVKRNRLDYHGYYKEKSRV